MTVLRQLAEFAATASIADAGEVDRVFQRRHFADAVVAGIIGHSTEDARALRPLFRDRPMGYRAACVRLTEIDDIHCASCTTPSSAIVPTALTLLARDATADPAALADAVWVGTEVLTRLGAAVRGAWVLYQGVWPTYFAAPAGVAATAGRLLGLDASTMTNALAIALNLTAGGVGAHDAPRPPRWLLFAAAVEAGILATEAARTGYGGDAGLLDGPDWLRRTHGLALEPAALTDGLGSRTIYRDLSLKPYCCAKQAIAAVEAFRQILADGVDVAAIEAVEVRVPPAYAGMIGRSAVRGNRASTMVSVAYQIALAALRSEAMFDVARTDAPFDPEVMALAAKVRVGGDEALASEFPRRFPAAVVVRAGRRRYEREVIETTGDPTRPLEDAALAAKLQRVARTTLSIADVDDWIGHCTAGLAGEPAARALVVRYNRRMSP